VSSHPLLRRLTGNRLQREQALAQQLAMRRACLPNLAHAELVEQLLECALQAQLADCSMANQMWLAATESTKLELLRRLRAQP
jgi:hypothetical protein